MYPVSQNYLLAVANGYRLSVKCEHRNPVTGLETTLPVENGSVRVDVTQASRMTLSLSLPPLQSLFDLVTYPGGEITVTHTVNYVDGSVEPVPLGVFRCESQSTGYAPGDELTLTCPDRLRVVQLANFGAQAPYGRVSVPGNTVSQEVRRLVEGAFTSAANPFPGWASRDDTITVKVGPLIWQDGSRYNAITTMLDANNLELFADRTGRFVLRKTPVLTASTPSVWAAGAGSVRTLKTAARTRDTSVVRNVITLYSTNSTVQLAAIDVADTKPAASDPLSVNGGLGRQGMDFSSENFTTTAQMQAAGVQLLGKQLSAQQQFTGTCVPNAALDGWDVIDITLPAGDKGTRPTERHMLESFTIPFGTTSSDDMPIATRAARQSSDDSL
jgi:hypothetical protein